VQRKDGPARISQRPIMLKYKSWLQDYLSTVALWPLTLVGLQQESQELYVFMFEDLIDSSAHPVTRAKVSLSKPVQVYHAQLRFDAHFTGLRHLMYWYPMTSGAVIVAVIFAFEALALLLLYAVLLYSWAAAKREGVCVPPLTLRSTSLATDTDGHAPTVGQRGTLTTMSFSTGTSWTTRATATST
jgi:hypothetical protein